MALKRKLEVETDSVEASYNRPMKQLRSAPAAAQPEDIPMEETSYGPLNASTGSLDSDTSSYPVFNLYPFPSYEPSDDMQMDGVNHSYTESSSESRTSSNVSEESKPCVGLMQPKASFVHNISNCYQIPRLRVSCASGVSGQRTLWTQCDQCGAIDMIDT